MHKAQHQARMPSAGEGAARGAFRLPSRLGARRRARAAAVAVGKCAGSLYRGTILSTRRVTDRAHPGEPRVRARVALSAGGAVLIDLGRASALAGVAFLHGREIEVVAGPAHGAVALRADALRLGRTWIDLAGGGPGS